MKKIYYKQDNFNLRIKYINSNTVVTIPYKKNSIKRIKVLFQNKHLKTFGFYYDNKEILLDSVEANSKTEKLKFNLNLNS